MSHKLQQNDVVKFYLKGSNKPSYGWIKEYKRKKGCYTICGTDTEDGEIQLTEVEMTYMPTNCIPAESLKKLIRYECGKDDFLGSTEPEWNWRADNDHNITLEDMEEAVRNLKAADPYYSDFCKWFSFVAYELEGAASIDYDDLSDDDELETESDMAMLIFESFELLLDDETDYTGKYIDYDRILEDIANFRKNEPINPFLWNDAEKLKRISSYKDEDYDKMTANDIHDFMTTFAELADKGYPAAIKALGYSYYGGNKLFPCDWVKSRDCFLRLMEMDKVNDLDKCYYANTLGYIYYYGRCTDGVPDYENALKYYTIGAAGGIYESLYKLSDMFLHGYGTPPNKRAAETLVNFVYNDSITDFLQGNFRTQFADAALRKGNLCRDGISAGNAYYYYTVADFAIRKRLCYNHYGDTSVFGRIQSELAKIREKRRIIETNAVLFGMCSRFLYALFDRHSCVVAVRKTKKGTKVYIKRLPLYEGDEPENIIECYPDHGYCDLTDTIILRCDGDVHFRSKLWNDTFIADRYTWESSKGSVSIRFYHHGKITGIVSTDRILRPLKKQKRNRTEHTFAGVTFSSGGRVYHYIADGIELKEGDKVVVFANGEEKEVEVVNVFLSAVGDMPLEFERYKKILRKA